MPRACCQCFGQAGKSLGTGEKVILNKQNWSNAKNFLNGVHSSLKTKGPLLEAILEQDPAADAEHVLQQLADYTDCLLQVVEANTVKAPTTTIHTTHTTTSTYYNNYNSTSTYTYKKPDPPEYAGLYNQGATCYMNSLLQSLFLTPELRYALYNWQYTPERDPERDACIPYQMQRLFCQMQLMKDPAAETDSLTKSFGWAAGDQFQQQDATELLTKLTEALETCFKGTRGDGVIKALYEGVTKDYVKCRHCGHESGTKAVFQTLNLAIRPFGGAPITSVEEGLANYFKPEDMSGENQYECEPCKTKRDADKGIRLDKVPYVLTISLIRFDYDWEVDQRVKINDRVSFPETLDMAEYLDPSSEAAGGETEEEEKGYRIREDAGEILARGSSAVTDEEGMLYDLFAICVHSGGTHGGHYFAYCKPFGTKTCSGADKAPDQWYEMNDSRVTKLGVDGWKKAFGGATQSYSRGYTIPSSTSAYMLMYRRRDPKLNIDEVPDSIVPTYIFADQKAEEERKEAERQKKAEEYKKKQEEKRLKEAQIPVAVWHNERMVHLLPTRTDTWGDLKTLIFERFELPEDESELRIILHANMGTCCDGDISVIDEEDDTFLDDVELLDKHAVLQVESRVGDSPWQSQVAHSARAAVQALASPIEMMLCNQDGSNKHMRWFWVDVRAHTLSWSKKRFGEGKQRQVTGATASGAAGDPNAMTIHTAEGDDVIVVAPSDVVATQWVNGCRALVDAQDTLICFTDMDDKEFKHTIKLTQASTISEARALIAETLKLDPGEFRMKSFEGTEDISGYTVHHLRGPAPDYSLTNILTAAREISFSGVPLSCRNLKSWIQDHPTGQPREYARDNTVRVWNLTKTPVRVDRLTRMGHYNAYKKWVLLDPGYDKMVEPCKSLDDRGLTPKSMKSNTSVEGKMDDPSYNVERIAWKLSVVGESGQVDFDNEWSIGRQQQQNVFVEGFGEDEAPLAAPRLVFTITKNKRFGVKSEAPPAGHHKVPIYRFQGSTSDASEFVFDMVVDETMLVRDFKMELAKKLQTEATGLEQVDGTKLRVREMPSASFPGEVFVDDVPLLTPVTKFTGVERFAFCELEGPEEKLSEKQVVITIIKFRPSSFEFESFFELVVQKSATLDSLRATLAERDPDIAAASDVALGCPEQLITGKYLRDLADTVWDTEYFNWDWDKSGWFAKSNNFNLARDGDVYYYKDTHEDLMEWTEEEAKKARKRAMIEKNKKKQQAKNKFQRGEAEVVMRVARGGDAGSPTAGDKSEGKGTSSCAATTCVRTTPSLLLTRSGNVSRDRRRCRGYGGKLDGIVRFFQTRVEYSYLTGAVGGATGGRARGRSNANNVSDSTAGAAQCQGVE